MIMSKTALTFLIHSVNVASQYNYNYNYNYYNFSLCKEICTIYMYHYINLKMREA